MSDELYHNRNDDPEGHDRLARLTANGDLCYANAVARNLCDVEDREHRALAWFAHGCAVQLGGFSKLAAAVVETIPDVVGSPALAAVKDQSLPIAREILYGPDLGSFLWDSLPKQKSFEELHISYSAAMAECRRCLLRSGPLFLDFCCGGKGPDTPVDGTALTIRELLRRFAEAWSREQRATVANTEIRRQVWEALDYAAAGGAGITLIQGDPRTGKSVAAEQWARANLDRARYLTLESTLTDSAFFMEINRALGNPKAKNAIQNRLRNYIREVMELRDLILVVDEAQWLWGNSRRGAPNKINFIMTALVNRGCSVALIVTPQFMAEMDRFERETQWAAAQFRGRIINHVPLPERISDEEIRAVAKCVFPEGRADAIDILTAFAKASASYLAGVRTATQRARFLAQREGVPVGTAHVRDAITAATALIGELAGRQCAQPDRSRTARIEGAPSRPPAANAPAHGPCKVPASRMQTTFSTHPRRQIEASTLVPTA